MMRKAFKRRLRQFMISTSERQSVFLKNLEEQGCPTRSGTLSKWLNVDERLVPDAIELMAIARIKNPGDTGDEEDQISMDYILGKRPAKTEAERHIEKRTK